MASGFTHFWVTGIIALCFLAGGVGTDLDHWKLLGGTHTIKQLWNGFTGKQYKDVVRNDSKHFFHKPIFYKTIFYITTCLIAFSAGLLLHLKLDRII